MKAREENGNVTVGGCDLGVVRTKFWRKTRQDKVSGKDGLLHNIFKYWVCMRAKLGTAVFFNI